MLRRLVFCAWLSMMACQPDSPTLELGASPTRIDGKGSVTTITVTALQNAMTPGKGTVRLSSAVGSFSTPQTLTLDGAGTATETFTCDTASEVGCTGRLTITGDWLFKQMAISGEVKITVQAGGGTSGAGGGASGGSTAGGSTAGGMAAAGGAAGGSTAGGATAGGMGTAGGMAGGGSTAGGATSGGMATAGGMVAGGASGGRAGGTAGGGSAGGSMNLHYTPTPFSPDEIVVFGTLVRNSCEGALARLTGTNAFIGVPCALNPQLSALQPDGGFVYQHPTSQRIFAAVPDALGVAPGGLAWAYPSMLDNDVDLTPACTGTVSRFVVRPSGGVVAQCANGTWMEGAGVLPFLDGENVLAFARTGEALVSRDAGVVLIAPSGAVTQVNVPFTPTTKMIRATSTGFYAVQSIPSTSCSLHSIALDGTVIKVGDYTTTGVQPPICNGRIDATGTLYFGLSNIGGAKIVRRPLAPADSTDVYVNTSSTVWSFNNVFNVVLYDGNGITTGR